jgi:hypothetical protein
MSKRKKNKSAEYWLAKVRELELRKNGVNEKTTKPKKKKYQGKKKKVVKKKVAKKPKIKDTRTFKEKYYDYLKSDSWKIKRDKVLKRAGNKCEICGKNRAYQVHHKTYKRVFRERLCDLSAICRVCHKSEHNLLSEEEIEIAVLELIKSDLIK